MLRFKSLLRLFFHALSHHQQIPRLYLEFPGFPTPLLTALVWSLLGKDWTKAVPIIAFSLPVMTIRGTGPLAPTISSVSGSVHWNGDPPSPHCLNSVTPMLKTAQGFQVSCLVKAIVLLGIPKALQDLTLSLRRHVLHESPLSRVQG